MQRLILSLWALVIAAPLLAAHADDTGQLDQARLAHMIQTLGDPAKREQLIEQMKLLQKADQPPPTPEMDAEQKLNTLSGEIDRNGETLLRRLKASSQPWMWWAAGFSWAIIVLVIGKLIERGVARLFPGNKAGWLGRVFRVICYAICGLAAIYLFLQAFGASDLAGPVLRIEGKLILLAAAFGIADLALLLVNLAIERYLASGSAVERSPRVMTLLPLLRNIVMVALGALLGLVVLGQLGINIAPLLAGAGVVGVAVGFGAQKLVQDVITGAFILFENTLAVGDTVKIGEHTGSVEGMTIRTLRLRDGYGQLHTVPFSSVTNVINMSRDFGFYPFELNVSYQSDIDRAMAVIGETVAEMQKDPDLAGNILAPAEIFGVERLGEWSMVLSGRIKTPPGQQTVVARAFNRRIKAAFDKAGVELAVPTSVVRLIKP